MIRHHMHRNLTEAMRRRWVELAFDAADEAGLPVDAEFRAAFVGYLEWGTRLAVMKLPTRRGAASGEPAHAQMGLGTAGRALSRLTLVPMLSILPRAVRGGIRYAGNRRLNGLSA